MKKKIIFRADAHKGIGSGDLVSLIHLSRYFESDQWATVFLVRNHSPAIRLLELFKIKDVVLIDKDANLEDEIVAINCCIKAEKADAILFEITERDTSEYKDLSHSVIKGCVSFNFNINPDMDLVINWDVGIEERFDRKKFPKIKFLFGPEYVILPFNFEFTKISERVIKKRPEDVIIVMGGADDLNFTQLVADALIKNSLKLNFKFVIGPSYKYKKELKKALLGSRLNFEIKQGVINMFQQYMSSDMAIAAGGLTLFELIAARLPSAVISTYEHQIPRCNYLHNLGLIDYLGHKYFEESRLVNSLFTPRFKSAGINFKPTAIKDAFDELLK